MRIQNWKLLILTFAVSFVLGSVFGRWEFCMKMHDKWKDPHARQRWILKRLDRGLNLNKNQEKQVEAILKEAAPEMERVKNKIRPELEAVRQKVRERIMPVLNPEQQKKYAAMEAEWEERKKKYSESLAGSVPAP